MFCKFLISSNNPWNGLSLGLHISYFPVGYFFVHLLFFLPHICPDHCHFLILFACITSSSAKASFRLGSRNVGSHRYTGQIHGISGKAVKSSVRKKEELDPSNITKSKIPIAQTPKHPVEDLMMGKIHGLYLPQNKQKYRIRNISLN